jgi:hypothetical protein
MFGLSESIKPSDFAMTTEYSSTELHTFNPGMSDTHPARVMERLTSASQHHTSLLLKIAVGIHTSHPAALASQELALELSDLKTQGLNMCEY